MNNVTLRYIAITLMSAFLGCSSVSLAASQPATLTIQGPTDQYVNPALFGSNIQWESSGDGLVYVDNGVAEFYPQVISALKTMPLTSVRFPGGALTDTYQWQSAVGPVSQRAKGVNFSGALEPSLFGTDELLRFAQKLNIAPVISVNFNSTPASAVEWLAYIERNNKAQPAQYWEIGNEIYSPAEVGHTDAANYALKTNEFARALKAQDPSIKVGAVLEVSFTQAAWMAKTFPHMMTWNEDVISRLSADIDFVSVHFYAPFDKAWSNSETTKLILSAPIVFKQNLNRLKQLLRKYNRQDLKIAVTEYNAFYGDTVTLDKRTAQPEGALFNGLLLFEMMRDPQIVLANHWSLLNNNVFGLLSSAKGQQIEYRPAYDVFQQLAGQAGWRIVQSHMDSPTFSVSAKGNVPNMRAVPMLDTLVTLSPDGQRLRLNIINRSVDKPLRLSFKKETPAQWAKVSRVSWQTWRAGKGDRANSQWTSEAATSPPDTASVEVAPMSFYVLEWSLAD